MAQFAIGDIQGCYQSLQKLLKKVKFNASVDKLWVAGDMINRGPDNLNTLRFLSSLGSRCFAVLGNHDLHFLAIALAGHKIRSSDTFSDILNAPDRDELISWLLKQPLVHYDQALGFFMSHAGVPPIWTLEEALGYASEVKAALAVESSRNILLAKLYGNKPVFLSEAQTEVDRWRAIINYFTRMRFCTLSGELELKKKGRAQSAPLGTVPWYSYPSKMPKDLTLLFGHWAALSGKTGNERILALDTGCVWGGKLTAFDLEKKTYHRVKSVD